MSKTRKRDISESALAQSADRCVGCRWRGNERVCKQCGHETLAERKRNGGANTAACDALMGIFKDMKIEVIDVTPKMDKADEEFLSRVAERGASPRPASFVLPWPPTVNTYYRNVNGRMLISRKGREYRKAVCSTVSGVLPRTWSVRLTINAWPPDRRKRDLDNLLKAPLDALKHAGIYADDSQICDLRIIRRAVVSGGRLNISVEQMEGQNEHDT